jgi:hypothetical protein
MGDLFALVRLPDHPASDANSIAMAVPTALIFADALNINELDDMACYSSMTGPYLKSGILGIFPIFRH